MLERTDGGSTSRVSRRSALALPVVLGLAGCSQLPRGDDQYIQVMQADPMYSWKPPVDVIVPGSVALTLS